MYGFQTQEILHMKRHRPNFCSRVLSLLKSLAIGLVQGRWDLMRGDFKYVRSR